MWNVSDMYMTRGTKTGLNKTVPALECLEQRIALAATPVAADFSAAKNDSGLNRISVDGLNLLQGSGFHIIGSLGTADNLFNVASESPHNSGGIMRAYNGSSQGGSVPYSLKFTPNSTDKSKLNFDVQVGKPSADFQVMNIPLEANLSHFNFWRTSNSQSLKRFDQNRFSYTTPEGNYYIEGGSGNWGEIIGTKYTIRVTINSSTSPMGLAFVNAPQLGGGIRDVEFGFNGLTKSQIKKASGTIQVFRTDLSLLPSKTYQSESNAFHVIGRRDGDGWKSTSSERGYLQYGPYIKVDAIEGVSSTSTNLTSGKHIASLSLQIDNNTKDNDLVATFEIYDASTKSVLKSLEIRRKTFGSANRYQDFSIDFDAKLGQNLELRLLSHGKAALKINSTTLV